MRVSKRKPNETRSNNGTSIIPTSAITIPKKKKIQQSAAETKTRIEKKINS